MDEKFAFPIQYVTQADAVLPRRNRETSKRDYGRALIIAGSIGYTGAPAFSSRACVRSGAGLVFLGVPRPIYQIEALKNDEAIVFPLPSDNTGKLSIEALDEIMTRLNSCGGCLIGPGLGMSEDIEKIVTHILRESNVPIILDADGINCVAKHIDVLNEVHCPLVLTPHDGEFKRLLPSAGSMERNAETREFAMKYNVVLVRKGHRTITAFPDGKVFINTTGNPGMAKGGSGDVLAGMILAFAVQGIRLKKSVPAAVFLHGRAGDLCDAKFGEYALTPSDMIEELKNVLR